MDTYENAIRAIVALPLGLAFGSFLTVVIHRVPAGESVLRPRSRCPSCGARIRGRDNIPVVSWLLLRGRCQACGARIPRAYPLTELACATLFTVVALVRDDVWSAALLAPFLAILLAISVIDLRHKRIPNRIVYPGVVLSTAFIVVADASGSEIDAVRAGIGLVAYGLVLLIVALVSPRGMGMGDVKLAGWIGLVCGALGLGSVGVAAAAGIVFGGIGALVALLAGAGRKTAIPFGPFLAAGAVVAVLGGEPIADAYLRLMT